MLVFDASTIILLAKTELLDIVIEGYEGKLIISEAVEDEISKKGNFDTLFIKKRLEEGKLTMKKAENELTTKIMKDFNINLGEAATIAIALQNGAMAATDDKNAINACKVLRVPFITAISFLVIAKEKGGLSKEKALAKLESLSLYGRYSKKIVMAARIELTGG